MKTNYHTHSTWCDGADSPRAIIEAAIEKGFDVLGFSSHAMLPADDVDWVLTPEKALRYAGEIRALAAEYADRIRVMCGVEADFVRGKSDPDRKTYAAIAPDYIIGSVHFVEAPNGSQVAVDHAPQILADGIARHFGGDATAFVKAYFAQQREMAERFDFDVIGHPDLVRKFNVKHPYFDETADWYLEELRLTADAFAKSGKLTEVNAGAIPRGWLDDAYPSATFRGLLRERGVKFILSADAHSSSALDCAIGGFADAETYVELVK